MLNIANSENGTNLLMQMTLNAFMKSEHHLDQKKKLIHTQMVIEKEKHLILERKMVLKRIVSV
jgi:hypothetical protein